jgi:phenylalanine-4-hydroxylase
VYNYHIDTLRQWLMDRQSAAERKNNPHAYAVYTEMLTLLENGIYDYESVIQQLKEDQSLYGGTGVIGNWDD